MNETVEISYLCFTNRFQRMQGEDAFVLRLQICRRFWFWPLLVLHPTESRRRRVVFVGKPPLVYRKHRARCYMWSRVL